MTPGERRLKEPWFSEFLCGKDNVEVKGSPSHKGTEGNLTLTLSTLQAHFLLESSRHL